LKKKILQNLKNFFFAPLLSFVFQRECQGEIFCSNFFSRRGRKKSWNVQENRRKKDKNILKTFFRSVETKKIFKTHFSAKIWKKPSKIGGLWFIKGRIKTRSRRPRKSKESKLIPNCFMTTSCLLWWCPQQQWPPWQTRPPSPSHSQNRIPLKWGLSTTINKVSPQQAFLKDTSGLCPKYKCTCHDGLLLHLHSRCGNCSL